MTDDDEFQDPATDVTAIGVAVVIVVSLILGFRDCAARLLRRPGH